MRLVSILCLALAAAFCGCIGGEREYVEAERLKRKRPYFPPVELKPISFEQHWETRLYEREVVNMYFMNGNIFTETRGHYFYKVRAKDGFVKWAYDLGDDITVEPFLFVYDRELPGGPVVYDEVYALCHDTLHCIDEEEGFRIWIYVLRNPAAGPPFASRSHIYYGGWDDRLHAVDKNDLTQDWEYVSGADITAGGQQKEPIVFFASWDGKVYCADAARGTINWVFACQRPVTATPFFYKNRLYVGSRDFYLYSIKTTDGMLEWKFPCEAEVVTTPVAVDMTVFCAAENRYFFAIDRKDGKLKWKLKDGVKLLLLGRQNAYVLTRRKEIAAVDNETGELRWKKSFANVDFFVTNPADIRDIKLGKADYCIYFGFKNGWLFAIREKEMF